MNLSASFTQSRGWFKSNLLGIVLCVVIGLAAVAIAGRIGGATFLYALLLGALLHPLQQSPLVGPGIDFCARQVLRVGVSLLGARITFSQVSEVGWTQVIVLVLAIATTIAFGIGLAMWLGMPRWKGLLSGGATAICGASAALALAAALPRGPEKERFTLVVVVAVTALSTVAMVSYPIIVQFLHLSTSQAGLFLGGAIHDVAQVVAAGFMISDETGERATIVKLLRVASLAVVVACVAAVYRGESSPDGKKAPLLPWFMVIFIALATFNSLNWISPSIKLFADESSRAMLVVAISALGAKSSFGGLISAGWRAALLIVGETVWIAVFILACIWWLHLYR